MRRRSSVELEINQDRWLVSYADFVTLLFAFFVVMYSISQVNEGKYRVLSNELMKVFDVPSSAIAPIQVGDPTRSLDPSVIDQRAEDAAKGADEEEGSTTQNDSTNDDSPANLEELSEQFSERFADLIAENVLSVNGNELWLELELKSSILFPSANADPSLQAKAIFEEIATLLADYNNPVQVEGFTDNVPINNRRFKNNWELSSARAASVVKLLANNGVDPTRLSAVGYGEHRPAADNDTEEGRAKNRRVIVMVSREASDRPSINQQEMDRVAQPIETATGTGSNSQDVNERVNEIDDPLADPIGAGQSESTTANQNSIAPAVITEPSGPPQPLIKPVELNNGGLLFTSDPDLPRNNLLSAPRAEKNESEANNSGQEPLEEKDDLIPEIQ